MPSSSTFTVQRTSHPTGRVHIVGAGPTGLLMAALLQSRDGPPIRLYEKRAEYVRDRHVSLASYLVADSIESYAADMIDGESVEAIFEAAQLEDGLAFRRSIEPDLKTLLQRWTTGFVPLNEIERSLSTLIESRAMRPVERLEVEISGDDALAALGPDDILIDCSGAKSLFRDRLIPSQGEPVERQNTLRFRLEHALVVTFLYGQHYDCNEFCKYYKNEGNRDYKFIPAVHRTFYDGAVSHVTGIVTISAEEFAAMPSKFDGGWLREHFPEVSASMDRFIDKIKEETHGEILGDLEVVRIPLDLYRARNATNRKWRNAATTRGADAAVAGDSGGGGAHPMAAHPMFLVGDSAIGSPYFQAISLGFECAMYLADLIGRTELSVEDMIDRYEAYVFKQWLRVYMRSRMIKHNKDLLGSIDEPFDLLAKLHIY
jgi:2-polyprenyl-6-methoxyphenol hydroxylase-like FAD-dependent oxidoreductase